MSETPKDAKSIFLAALDIQSPGERAAFVARSCEGDDPLRKRVDDLLRAYGESGGPLNKMAAAIAPTQLGEPIREQVGSTIGSYKLMEQIGEGGFGLVFVAEQQQPIRRKVALKIIKPGMDTRDVIARFEAERQALALMDHPNIARVLDAGTTESGRPYFVMELVRGIPITEYCDQAQLTPRERLELFVPVCNAIQHAHLKGIIHRDVKPSNVLITLHDDRPVVKVIDFGVAKALHQQLTDRTIYTRYAQMIGTPLYMSPEQAQMSGLDIDTRSDIYSLGVLLYELLTGSTPFNKERLAKAAYDELLKIIREEEPPKPSLRLSQSGDSLPSIAAQRKTEPAKLSKMFHGDLDWIAMKALEKDRTRRYETANAFAADVLRYLNDEPVEASPPSAAYRIRKFARKHRSPVIALAAIVAILVAGMTGTTWGLLRARQAEQAAKRAEGAAIESQQETVDALGREASQRNQAERELANGILRPIGLHHAATDEGNGRDLLSPAEWRSFVDWSAVKDSQLKLRVLKAAFDDPETALRVARRAECAIQSCVGLSPSRRAQATRVLSTKQRDLSADPRVRIAACWLALAIGSADLSAWNESCHYLSRKKDVYGSEFKEFVRFAASRKDPTQPSQLHPDTLLEVLETSTDGDVLEGTCDALIAFAPRLDSAQTLRALNAVIQIAGAASVPDYRTPAFGVRRQQRFYGALRRAIDAFLTRLEPEQTTQVARSLVGALDNLLAEVTATNGYAAGWHQLRVERFFVLVRGLKPVLPSLDAPQAFHVAQTLTALSFPWLVERGAFGEQFAAAIAARLEDGHINQIVDTLLKGPATRFRCVLLAAMAPRMQVLQAAHAWEVLIRPTEENDDTAAQTALAAVGARLDRREVMRAAGASITLLEKSTDSLAIRRAIIEFMAVLPRLEKDQVTRGIAALSARRSAYDDSTRAATLVAIAPHVEAAEARRVWDALFAYMGDELQSIDEARVAKALTVLLPRLKTQDVESIAEGLIASMKKTPDWPNQAGLALLAPRLTAAQAARAMQVVIAPVRTGRLDAIGPGIYYDRSRNVVSALATRVDQSEIGRVTDAVTAAFDKGMSEWIRETANSLSGLIVRLDQKQTRRVGDVLIAGLQRQATHADWPAIDGAVGGLIVLEPRLEPTQVVTAWKVLSALAAEMPHDPPKPLRNAWEGLGALAPRLEPALQDERGTAITTALLDYSCSDGPASGSTKQFAKFISSARSLAKLMSHPGCVGEQREVLLERFEELVLHDGRPVLLKLDATEGSPGLPKSDPPSRRFHTLHDAAAWIQQNWPDFDLETNCPATWRGSR